MDNPFNLYGKRILITGASSGIGKETAIATSGMGAQVIISGRSKKRLMETFGKLEGKGHSYFIGDLTDATSINELVEMMGVIDGTVFAAGIIDYTPSKFVDINKIKRIFDINFNAQILLVQTLQKRRMIRKNSSLVFISSISSKLGVPATMLYAASKAALNCAVKVLASELARQNIRVNALCPGLVRTPMINKDALNNLDPESLAKTEKSYPLGIGTPVDIANASIFFLSDASRWITGLNMIIDGGHTLT